MKRYVVLVEWPAPPELEPFALEVDGVLRVCVDLVVEASTPEEAALFVADELPGVPILDAFGVEDPKYDALVEAK